MTKLFAILLSIIILMQSLAVSYDDIVQLDELIEHAEFHKQEYGDNFLVFLSKHYGELKEDHSSKHQEEQKDHDQLPFQCQDHILSIAAFVVASPFLELESVEFTEMQSPNFYYCSPVSSLHPRGLFQPPKQA